MPVCRYADYRNLRSLLRAYGRTPSLTLIRVPEMRYLEAAPLAHPRLDHCCGNGLLSTLIWDDGFEAGVDFSDAALKTAATRAQADGTRFYGETAQADVANRLPWPDGAFQSVINNSGLEHVNGVSAALAEASRVLSPGGRFVFTLAGRRAFDWWPGDLPPNSMEEYTRQQPCHNIHSLAEWRDLLAGARLDMESYETHFDRAENERNLRFDYHHSMRYFAGRPLPGRLALLRRFPLVERLVYSAMIRRASYHSYPDADAGAFLCITAVKRA